MWLVIGVASPTIPTAAAQASVAADRDGWWNRASGGTAVASPAAPLPVPANGLAVAASNGEPEKAAAVGVRLDVDRSVFQRLILYLAEAEGGLSTVGTQVAAIKACPIEGDWAPVKGGPWPPPPAGETGCAKGSRAAEGVWSFDLSTIAVRWLDGSLAQNGVLLVEDVAPPASFQVTWGDRSTGDVSFGLDVAVQEESSAPPAPPAGEPAPAGETDAPPPATGGSSDFASTPTSFQLHDGGAFDPGAPVEPQEPALPEPGSPGPPPVASGPRPAAPSAGTQSISLTDNLPAGTPLLGPLALVVAGLAAYSLGPAGRPPAMARREGGVSRALARRRAD